LNNTDGIIGPENGGMVRARTPAWVWSLAIAAAAGAILSIEAANLSAIATNGRAEWTALALAQLRTWLVWAVLAPFIYRLMVRFPVSRTRISNVLVHIAGSAVCAGLHAAVSALVTGSAPPMRSNLWSLVAYWDILGVSYAVDSYRRLQDRAVHAALLERQLAQAQLLALKMQLQPHFLFNALNSVASLLRSDLAGAEHMLARLGDFLRLTLEEADHQEVPLRQEIEYLRCYLEIEQIRFRERLSVRFDVEPAALDHPVPSLILQPILENAIRHGIARKTTPGCVEIRASRDEGGLALRVQDDGPGVRGLPADGNGLSITRARLRELYGDASLLQLAGAPDGGTIVTLRIPATARAS
jgi:hypothetical protein